MIEADRVLSTPRTDSSPMTVDNLIAEARRNSTSPAGADLLSPSNVSDFLRFALGQLLEDIDYEADKKSGGAIAARVLACIIDGADQIAARAMQ
jgi:hypothetical protein